MISNAVERYCAFLKNEIRAGNSNSINSLIYEKHKNRILSVLKNSMLPDEKNHVRTLLMKGKKNLNNNNYEKALEYFEQSLAIVQNSPLKAFQAYKYYENEILSALNDGDMIYFKKGYLQFKRKWYSPQEYEKALQKHGYVKDEGEWYSPAEYEELMISRGFYKYNNEYFTQGKFIEHVIKPVLRSKCQIEEWINFDKIDIKVKGSDGNDIVYEIIAVATVYFEDYKVTKTASINAVFNKKSDQWRFINPHTDSSLKEH